MANVTSAMVTIKRRWREGGMSGKDRLGMIAEIKGPTGGIACGTATNKIPASAFGLTVIESCSNANYDNAKLIPAVPLQDGSIILLADAASGTQANHENVNVDFTIAQDKIMKFEIFGW